MDCSATLALRNLARYPSNDYPVRDQPTRRSGSCGDDDADADYAGAGGDDGDGDVVVVAGGVVANANSAVAPFGDLVALPRQQGN